MENRQRQKLFDLFLPLCYKPFPMDKRPLVILRRCESYDPELISNIIRQGIEQLDLVARIKGRITIKPNVVMAHPEVAPSAYTRPEFLDGLLRAIESMRLVREGLSSEQGKETGRDFLISIAEKCGAGLPTTRMFRHAGYYRLKREHAIRLVAIEEARKRTIRLEKGVIHKKITTAREMVERDFFIAAPKLKTNVLSHGLTAALKLNMGLLCDRERMWNHNFNLDEKIVDLLEVGYPDFIVTDAIEIACGGNQLTEWGFPLGLIIMAKDPLAHDVVCSHVLHLNPEQIGHLRAAARRGYGSLRLEDVELGGDISLEEIREKTKNLVTGFIRVEEAHKNIRVLNGEPYCTGGCQGVFLDWLYMIRDRKPGLWARLPAWTVVIGKYPGSIEARRLLILGDCTEVQGKIRARKKRRIRGCPPKHKTLVLWLLLKAGIVNPLFRLDLILDAYFFLFLSWVRRVLKGRL
jgi:uncharacterized protein (DUF362 family)